jgi:hypothetical protein
MRRIERSVGPRAAGGPTQLAAQPPSGKDWAGHLTPWLGTVVRAITPTLFVRCAGPPLIRRVGSSHVTQPSRTLRGPMPDQLEDDQQGLSVGRLGKRNHDPLGASNVGHPPSALVLTNPAHQPVAGGRRLVDGGLQS